MIKKDKMCKVLCTLLISGLIFTGCGNTSQGSDETTETNQENVETSDEQATDTITGRIKEINDKTITLIAMGGEIPDGQPGGGNAPEKPEGEAPDERPGGGALEKPEGEAPDGQPGGGNAPDMPEGEALGGQSEEMETIEVTVNDNTVIKDTLGEEADFAILTEGVMITAELDTSGNALTISLADMGEIDMQGGPGPQGGPGGMGGSNGAPESYEAVTVYAEDAESVGETFVSEGADENAVLVESGANVLLSESMVSRISSDSTGGDDSSFYGIGAALLVTDGTLTITDSTIETDASGGAGVFSYGDGIVKVSDTTITTKQDTSGGIHVAGGGTLYAENLQIETDGESAAAIRSDRGGGTMYVSGGSYTSNGLGSPAVYCTAEIEIENAVLTATGSEAVCIEGLNSLSLADCELSGDMQDLEQNDCTWTVILYQSMSGDSEIGNSTFSMNGGSLTSHNGGLFYTTNTESTFSLSDVDIKCNDENEFFLKCTGNSNARGWGASGANGADCIFSVVKQLMEGDIIWDSISTLEFEMAENSTLTGAFVQDESNAGAGGDGYANLTIDETSKWVVTSDSTLSELVCKGSIEDENGNAVTIVDFDGNVLESGDSSYTIKVESYQK
ncbi:MAG: hypothetical protein HDR04_18440 [Lachnospiraceae bacterium]|nr:hypothetical protein [Lachnospiraceae bacterium]